MNIAESLLVNQNLPPVRPAKARELLIKGVPGVVIQISHALTAKVLESFALSMVMIGGNMHLGYLKEGG